MGERYKAEMEASVRVGNRHGMNRPLSEVV